MLPSLEMFLISVSRFWKTQTVIACLSLVSFQVISLQSLTEDLLNTRAICFLRLLLTVLSSGQSCFLNFLHHIFLVFEVWKLMGSEIYSGTMCSQAEDDPRELTLRERFIWLGCAFLWETYGDLCLWCCPQSVFGQSFYDVYCLGSKSIFTVPSTTWTTQWCWCWLPYNWRHNSASTMKVCLESLIDWLNFTGHVELLAIFCCGYPVLLNEFKHMNILFIGEFLLFTLTFIMCIFLKRWSKIYLFLTIFSGGQKWSKRRWCHYTPVIPTLGRQRQEDPELKTIWGYTLNFMFKVKDNNNNTMNKNTFFL